MGSSRRVNREGDRGGGEAAGAGTPRSGVRGTDVAAGEGHSPAVPKPSSSPAFHWPPCRLPALSAILRLLHLGVPARTPGHGLMAGQGTCLEQGQDGGTRMPTGSGGGRLLRPGQRGTQGLRHVSGTRDQPHPGLCGELCVPPVSALPPVDRPRVLLGLQGDWEPRLTSAGVRTTPPSAPPPWGDTALTPVPTRSLRSIRGGEQPISQTGHGAQPPPRRLSTAQEGYPSRRCRGKDGTWI